MIDEWIDREMKGGERKGRKVRGLEGKRKWKGERKKRQRKKEIYYLDEFSLKLFLLTFVGFH